jgi:hypothetical protein
MRTRIGQYSVRTVYQKGRLGQLNKFKGEYKLAVLGVSEARWNGSGRTETTNGNVFVYGEIPTAALQWNPQGIRKRGRPKNCWRRMVIKEAGRSWNEIRFLAADRSGKNS